MVTSDVLDMLARHLSVFGIFYDDDDYYKAYITQS